MFKIKQNKKADINDNDDESGFSAELEQIK